MEKKVKISIQFICLILAGFLISCGVKGDPEKPEIESILSKN